MYCMVVILVFVEWFYFYYQYGNIIQSIGGGTGSGHGVAILFGPCTV